MKIPKKVTLGGIPYKVSFKKRLADETIVGEVDYTNQKIRILKGLAKETAEQTYIHELTHAMFMFLGWEQDEQKIEQLSSVLYMVMKENE